MGLEAEIRRKIQTADGNRFQAEADFSGKGVFFLPGDKILNQEPTALVGLHLESFNPLDNFKAYEDFIVFLSHHYTLTSGGTMAQEEIRFFDKIYLQDQTEIWSLTQDGEILAALCTYFDKENGIYSFSSLAVDSENRRKGLATFLLNSVVGELLSHESEDLVGFYSIVDKNNLGSQKLFKKLGFIEVKMSSG